jgi:AcrR family transcriptional regulator
MFMNFMVVGEFNGRSPNGGPRASHGTPRGLRDTQRERLLDAVAWLSYEHGIAAITVEKLIGRSGVSRKTFYELFANTGDCLAAAVRGAVELAADDVLPAYHGAGAWKDKIRAGLVAALAFLDEHPHLGQLCVVDIFAAGPAALTYRARVLSHLADAVDGGHEPSEANPTDLTAECVVGGVLAVLHSRLLLRDVAEPLVELLGPLTAFIVLPYLGANAAREEVLRPDPPVAPRRPAAARPLGSLGIRVTHRTLLVLASIGEEPGVSNRDVCRLAGITDQGQASKLLHRLERAGLIENTGDGQPKGAPNAWRLSDHGREINQHLRRTAR